MSLADIALHDVADDIGLPRARWTPKEQRLAREGLGDRGPLAGIELQPVPAGHPPFGIRRPAHRRCSLPDDPSGALDPDATVVRTRRPEAFRQHQQACRIVLPHLHVAHPGRQALGHHQPQVLVPALRCGYRLPVGQRCFLRVLGVVAPFRPDLRMHSNQKLIDRVGLFGLRHTFALPLTCAQCFPHCTERCARRHRRGAAPGSPSGSPPARWCRW